MRSVPEQDGSDHTSLIRKGAALCFMVFGVFPLLLLSKPLLYLPAISLADVDSCVHPSKAVLRYLSLHHRETKSLLT